MVIRGRIQNGVVTFGSDVSLPDGMEVTVMIPIESKTAGDTMSEQEIGRIRRIMDDIASLPDEKPGDTFSGADHDRVLYGEL